MVKADLLSFAKMQLCIIDYFAGRIPLQAVVRRRCMLGMPTPSPIGYNREEWCLKRETGPIEVPWRRERCLRYRRRECQAECALHYP